MVGSSRRDQVRERLNIPAFFAGELGLDLGTLRHRGDNVTVLCPFHDDRNTPNLSINLVSGLFKCFACEAQGDVFEFYQKRHACDFKEALTALADKAGVPAAAKSEGKYESLTVKEFALAKKLPVDFLEAQGIGPYRYPPDIFDGALTVNFPYKDQDGKNVGNRRRFGGTDKTKKFKFRKGEQVRLYGLWRLPEIRAAGWCLLVEGESDSLTCWLHQLPCLGIPGLGNWKSSAKHLNPAELAILQGLEIYVWQEPGAEKMPLDISADLPQAKVIPAPKEFKDLSEAHCQGQDIPKLLAALKKNARPPAPPPVIVSGGFTFSDLGNARRLVARHGKDLHYCHLSKKWYVWDGRRWRRDDSGEVERRAKDTVGGIYQEAGRSADLEERKAFAKFALKTEESKNLIAMVRQAQSEPGMPVAPKDLDANPWLLNCANGTVDLTTGELKPHRREDLLTIITEVEYDPEANCNLWERFLYEIMDVNNQPQAADRMVSFLQRALGYSLSGSIQEDCFFILWGNGANGKSTLVNTISTILARYATNTPVETLLNRDRGGEIPADIARLDGPRFVTADEVDKGRRLAESLVKALTGRGTITARFLYGEHFEFTPQFKLWLSTNTKPIIRGTDTGIWRRIMFCRFPVEIPREQWDLELEAKLQADGAGILAWLVRGCLQWQREGLAPPPEVLAATAQYRAEMDVLGEFIEDRCVVAPGYVATAKELYESYDDWAEDGGIPEKQRLKQRTFGACLTERGFIRDRGAGGKRLWRGVALRVC